jgi:hypothetical protein
MPPERTLRTASGAPMPAEVVAVEKLVREERYDEAIAALRALRVQNVWQFVDAIGIADRAAELARASGARQQAIQLLELVLEAKEIDASAATSGSEGLGRLHEVEVTRERLAAWKR